jgi:hypothetical protein
MVEYKPLGHSEDSKFKLRKDDLIKFHATFLDEALGHLDFFYKYGNYTVVLLASIDIIGQIILLCLG